ncbi:DNA polymerase [Longispora fulva]|uniref:DNA polymerase I n=1 Tax=Longispora fulva TaxID=619741 RepID=A0A8J7H0R6_9ACTN|nr:DNA polymerase [Longispora fulva]MBG6140248.1 DNA polymerase-1 [Longispora fulva]
MHVVEREEDLAAFADFVRSHPVLAFDTETTGLDIFASNFRCRLAQFGTTREAWVVPVEAGPRFGWYAAQALRTASRIIAHNLTFDALVAERCLGVPLEELCAKSTDTRILSHLGDPRAAHEGGTGHRLEELTAAFIDKEVAERVKGSVRAMAKELKMTKAEFFRLVPLDHEGYVRYAGMDVILTARLDPLLSTRVPLSARKLIRYEHDIARVCAVMERRGFLLDVEYTRGLSLRLGDDEARYTAEAAVLGVGNINAPQQVADALIRRGVTIPDTTKTGKPKVDKFLLDALVSNGDPLAAAVQRAKRAGKWRETYADKFLELIDADGRIHCGINSLAARTARMSIVRPSLQTLPSKESLIRSCFLAEPGEVIISTDYDGMELRVLAALSGDVAMKRAFAEGADLHLMTAQAAFGPQATPKQRGYGKTANFAYVFGGGAAVIAKQCGIPLDTAKRVVDAFARAYPGVTRLAKALQAQARMRGHVTTVTGRVLPVDRGRIYSALNYYVQSSARDVLGRGLLAMDAAGLTPYLRLPVHDEVIGSAPLADAADIGKEFARLMAMNMRGVDISASPDVGGTSWGSLYEQ